MKTGISSLLDINNAIELNLESVSDRQLLSINLLSQLRNLIEAIMFLIYEKNEKKQLGYIYENIEKGRLFCQNRGNYRFLNKFHSFLQIATSHYTIDGTGSERLMIKYYEYLLKVRQFVQNEFRIEILPTLEKFLAYEDETYSVYYKEIAEKINELNFHNEYNAFDNRFYVLKVKPFAINKKLFYEITLAPAHDQRSKFDRVIVFSQYKIVENYAIKVKLVDSKIRVMGMDLDIKVVKNWVVSIRPCEINNLGRYFGFNLNFRSETKEYFETMKYLTDTGQTLLDIVTLPKEDYENLYNYLHSNKRISNALFSVISECRKYILGDKKGSNILRYILHTMNNVVIKNQYCYEANQRLSNLFISYSSLPFEEMPFCTSLVQHNPRLVDLFECIPFGNREEELLARKLINNTEQDMQLYTPLSELDKFTDIDLLKNKFYQRLYLPKHAHREIIFSQNHAYVKGYEQNTIAILNKILSLTIDGVDMYEAYVKEWLKSNHDIDDEHKISALKRMFVDAKVAAVYGSAGTGKTTLINHIASLFNENTKLIVANTNSAVDNLKNRVKAHNSTFNTVEKAKRVRQEVHILIVDEASTVSNENMLDLIEVIDYQLLIVVGDIYQIESIKFGNWFSLIKKMMPDICYELYTPFRSTDNNLLKLWELVRNNNDTIAEHIARNNYSEDITSGIFDKNNEDEIVLCLNYDGLYGINNVNRLMQLKNPNEQVEWGIWTYKKDDPIIFNETTRFAGQFHNNLKGRIVNIIKFIDKICFEVEVEKVINPSILFGIVELIKIDNGKSHCRFYVYKEGSTDDDSTSDRTIVPFQISYAVSIHKAQGLEYESVKLIITNEQEERLTHSVFYTAITRARKYLKIYWSPQVQQRVLQSFKLKNVNRDYGIIKNKLNVN